MTSGLLPHEVSADACGAEHTPGVTCTLPSGHSEAHHADVFNGGWVEWATETQTAHMRALYDDEPASSAGSQEPAPAEPTEKARTGDGLSVEDQLEPAPAERDERTWRITKKVRLTDDVVMIAGPDCELEDVVLRSERDYWRQAYEAADRSLKAVTVRGAGAELARVQEQLDQAREALKAFTEAVHDWAREASHGDPGWEAFDKLLDRADAALASGVTEKGNETDG